MLLRLAGIVVAAVCVAVVGLGAYAVLGRFVLHGPVTPGSLAVSVADGAGGSTFGDAASMRSCRRVGGSARVWTCTMVDAQDSGATQYRVTIRPGGSSCWTARRSVTYGESMPDTASGCVHRWQWTLL